MRIRETNIDDTDIAVRVRQIMAEIFEVAPEEIQAEFGPDHASLWDSMSNLQLIQALESEFGIEFSLRDLQSMDRFDRICERVSHYDAVDAS